MADLGPNLDLNKKRLQVRVTEMRLQLERFDLRKMEMQDELRKIEENIKSINLEIANALETLEKAK